MMTLRSMTRKAFETDGGTERKGGGTTSHNGQTKVVAPSNPTDTP
jgi:hypothetical protein